MRAGGDLRHAINLMQSGGGSGEAAFKDVSSSVSQGLNAFFEAADPASALAGLKGVSLPPLEKVREIHTCVVKSKLSPEKLAAALEVISRADVIMGEIGATREWRLLRYLDSLFAQELFPIIKGESVRYVSEDLPFPVLLRIWNDSKKIRELSVRYAAAHPRAVRAPGRRTCPTSSPSVPPRTSDGALSRPSTSTRPTTSSSPRRQDAEDPHRRLVHPPEARKG